MRRTPDRTRSPRPTGRGSTPCGGSWTSLHSRPPLPGCGSSPGCRERIAPKPQRMGDNHAVDDSVDHAEQQPSPASTARSGRRTRTAAARTSGRAAGDRRAACEAENPAPPAAAHRRDHRDRARLPGRRRARRPAGADRHSPLRPARRPLPQPRAVVARLQRPRARAGRGPQPAAAGARQVPGDLREQPRRVLHGPRRRAEAPRRGRPAGAQRGRPHPARAAGAHLRADAGPGRRAREGVPRRGVPGARQGGHPDQPVVVADRRAARDALDLLHRDRLPGADPAGGRPGAPVPLHLRPLAQPGRDRPRPRGPHRAVRAGEGAQQRPAPGPGRPRGPGRRVDHLPADRGPDRRAPVGAVHRHGGGRVSTPSGSRATRTWRSRRTATKTCCRRWSASWPAAGSGRRCGSRSSTR